MKERGTVDGDQQITTQYSVLRERNEASSTPYAVPSREAQGRDLSQLPVSSTSKERVNGGSQSSWGREKVVGMVTASNQGERRLGSGEKKRTTLNQCLGRSNGRMGEWAEDGIKN